ncbi:MAG: rhomboid family intramembrane serine protease [Actinomycetes bacterium]
MVAAPVGFQCRECVHQAAQTAPIYTPTAVSSARTLDPSRKPFVTYTIVGICVVVYLIGFLVPSVSYGKYGMVPVLIALDDQWYRLITAAFLHAGIIHIAFNMFVLIMLGPTLEKVLGHFRYVILYLLAALGGSICSYAFSDPLSPSVGASGAIFGLMGALIVAGRRLKFDITQVVVLLVINLLIGFIPGGNVDWRAHLGGLVTGALVALVLSHPVKRNAVLVQSVGCLAVVVVLAMVGGWRTAQLRNEYMLDETTPANAAAQPWDTIDIGINPRLNTPLSITTTDNQYMINRPEEKPHDPT